MRNIWENIFLYKICLFAWFFIKNTVKYYQPNAKKGGKGVMILNTSDLILHLVDKYIAEKEKNFMLQQKIEQQYQQMQDDNKVKTN